MISKCQDGLTGDNAMMFLASSVPQALIEHQLYASLCVLSSRCSLLGMGVGVWGRVFCQGRGLGVRESDVTSLSLSCRSVKGHQPPSEDSCEGNPCTGQQSTQCRLALYFCH